MLCSDVDPAGESSNVGSDVYVVPDPRPTAVSVQTVAHMKSTKSEIISSWSWFKHCSESLIYPIGSHIWSLFAPIHMKS